MAHYNLSYWCKFWQRSFYISVSGAYYHSNNNQPCCVSGAVHHRKCSCDIHHNIILGPNGEEPPPKKPCNDQQTKLDILEKCQDWCDKDPGCKGYVIHHVPQDRFCKCELATNSTCNGPETEFKHVDNRDPANPIIQDICNPPLHENKNHSLDPLSPYAECGNADETEWGDGCRIKGFGAWYQTK